MYTLNTGAQSNVFPDVNIKVYNDTNIMENIIIFVQEDELNLMFKKIFPVAWQVFPLPGKTEGVERWGNTIYPGRQQIGVTRNLESNAIFFINAVVVELTKAYFDNINLQEKINDKIKKIAPSINQKIVDKKEFLSHVQATIDRDENAIKQGTNNINTSSGNINIRIEATEGDRIDYRVDDSGGQHLTLLDSPKADGIIYCQNNTESLVAIDYYKNEAKVVTWPAVANGDEAKFKLRRKLFFTYDSNIGQGATIKEKITNQVQSVDLMGYTTVEAKLTYDHNAGGQKKIWVITAR
ncbi:hypothetical protein QUA00_32230 [Microcoleus sp. T2B6]|uniref:hypothetical protein n=1 Tax=unclassified Microcoleus TaxID=2642155 RepID=UPI002FD2B47B